MAEQGGRTAGGADGVHNLAEGQQEAAGLEVRHRTHRVPGRSRAVKVLYDEAEYAAVQAAASTARLTPSGYVAAAGLRCARESAAGMPSLGDRLDRELLVELLQARTALRRYGSNVNQAVAALHAGAGAPVWLRQAVAGCERAVDNVDALTLRLSRLIG